MKKIVLLISIAICLSFSQDINAQKKLIDPGNKKVVGLKLNPETAQNLKNLKTDIIHNETFKYGSSA